MEIIKGVAAFVLSIVVIIVMCSIKGTEDGTIPVGTAISIIFVCIGLIIAMYKKNWNKNAN